MTTTARIKGRSLANACWDELDEHSEAFSYDPILLDQVAGSDAAAEVLEAARERWAELFAEVERERGWSYT